MTFHDILLVQSRLPQKEKKILSSFEIETTVVTVHVSFDTLLHKFLWVSLT